MIKLTPFENGPIKVVGLKNVTGSTGKQSVDDEIYLCRCGGSANKPYCDGTHNKNAYSSERETKRDLNKVRDYVGKAITIHDNRTICSHSEICVKKLASVFNKKGQPWISADGDSTEAIIDLIKQCPSGALTYSVKNKHHNTFHTDTNLEILKNGPYQFKGEVSIEVDNELQPPSSDHFAICRCGASKNKPYCDGTHHAIKFKAD